MGLINEGGADGNAHVGAVQGGTGRFAGRTGDLPPDDPDGGYVGATPGQAVNRAMLDLMLPNPGHVGG